MEGSEGWECVRKGVCDDCCFVFGFVNVICLVFVT